MIKEEHTGTFGCGLEVYKKLCGIKGSVFFLCMELDLSEVSKSTKNDWDCPKL